MAPKQPLYILPYHLRKISTPVVLIVAFKLLSNGSRKLSCTVHACTATRSQAFHVIPFVH